MSSVTASGAMDQIGESRSPLPASRFRHLRVALVHDWLITLGGADRVLLALHDLYRDAPVFVALADMTRLPPAFGQLTVRPTWLQRIPGAVRRHRMLVPLMPWAMQGIDLRGYDLVISSSHACAHGVSTPGALHICYCHTPMRYAWDLRAEYLAAMPVAVRPAARAMLAWLRRRDWSAAQRVDHFIANSQNVADRVRRHYGREATVIYPPVDVEFFTPGPQGFVLRQAQDERERAPAAQAASVRPEPVEGRPGDEPFYLVVSRLVPYKRVDLAVEAFNRLGRPLVVVGDGPERKRLEAAAGPHVRFTGEVPDAQLRDCYRRCRALVFPGEEDFGLVPLEAQACGRPVIAWGKGGALESVAPGRTGLFFTEQSAASLAAAVRAFEETRFEPERIRAHAERFSRQRFMQEMLEFIGRVTEAGNGKRETGRIRS